MTLSPVDSGSLVDCEDLPLVEELSPPPIRSRVSAVRVARHCSSSIVPSRTAFSRYSFLAADPFAFVQNPANSPRGRSFASAMRRSLLRACRSSAVSRSCPLFGYDLGRQWERLPAPRADEFQIPPIAYGLYDVVLAWDHETNRAWLISQGFPEREPEARHRRAAKRLREFRDLLTHGTAAVPRSRPSQLPAVAASDLVPQFAVRGMPGLTSNFDVEGYLAAVRRAVEYVYAGDIFKSTWRSDCCIRQSTTRRSLHALARRNPATFAGYFDLGDFQIVSASPEQFLQVVDSVVETRPIKGTRLGRRCRKSMYSAADLFASGRIGPKTS
jgi:para-aminobenzoate synthetase component 1